MSEALREDYDPVMLGPNQLVSSTKLVRHLSSYLNMAKKKPVFVARDQEIEAVLISLDDYRQLLRGEGNLEELYQTALGLRRLIEHQKSGQQALSTESMLQAVGISRNALVEVLRVGGD